MSTANPLYGIVNPQPVPGVKMPLIGSDREAILDRPDYDLYCQHPWRLDTNGHVIATIHSKKVALKRWIMGVHGRGVCVFFRNGDKLDLRRCNLVVGSLRAACNTSHQNRTAKTSRYIGVYVRNGMWTSSIRIGSFRSEELAALAHDRVARFLGLPEDVMNFPLDSSQEKATIASLVFDS